MKTLRATALKTLKATARTLAMVLAMACLPAAADSLPQPPTLPTDAQVDAAHQRAASAALPSASDLEEAAAKAKRLLAAPEVQDNKYGGFASPLKLKALPGQDMAQAGGVVDRLLAQVSQKPPAAQGDALMVLVSFSMPKEALKLLAQQADKAGAALVLRGMVDGSFTKTTQAVRDVLGADAGVAGFQINPQAFRAYGVQDVPTFVLARHPPNGPNGAAADGGACAMGTDFVSVRGDVSVGYALRKLGENRGWEALAQQHLTQMGVHP